MKISWWQWIPIWGWRIIGVVEAADEIPVKLPRNAAVLVGTKTFHKWVAFDCPCRTGHRIVLNTDPARKPFWRLDPSFGNSLSILPSIDYLGTARRCHYFIRQAKIVWAKDFDR